MGDTDDHDNDQSTTKRRRRSRRAPSDRKFECSHEGCGKSYSRAEHLYRHQLNHTPKQIFRCDFPNCHRSFVRQDLCLRHRERHTTRGSQLQKRDSFSHENMHVTPPKSLMSVVSPASPSAAPNDYPFLASHPAASTKSPSNSTNTYSLPTTTPTTIDTNGLPVSNYSDFTSGISQADPPLEFDSMQNAYPIFGGETYNRSPFAMADDFAAWLFSEPLAPLGYGMMPFSQNQFYVNDPSYNNFCAVIPQHPMSVTSILDSSSLPAIISEEKRQEILHLMATRFNEAASSAEGKRKDALMDGDLNSDRHVLSLRMMQTYIGSYWFHFHPQLPILHQPTFSADRTPTLLLLAVMAIGAATLDKAHGQATTEAAAELATFIAWHLRWEIFMDPDFRPPARLWVFQALLLLEVYEKSFSTRAFHERAHIHHDTTLTLMRRGSSLIGRSSFDTPESREEDESWTHWIKAEATRRAAFAAFVLDSTHATMFGHSAKMVAHELRLPLPCDEALWAATSAAEVARVQSSLQSHGVRPVMFLDGLKRTLNGQPVRTNTFGRIVLMAGLLSVSWHLNQRDLQVSSLGVGQALGGRDKWRTALLRAYDNWRRDFDEALGPAITAESESRDVLHGLAHMASHVDIADLQIFAGAGRLMGRSITARDYSAAREKTVRWASKASARDATFYALKFLKTCFLDPSIESGSYVARDDYLLNRPWVMYYAALVVWCYGFALDGPLRPMPALATYADRRRDMHSFLARVGGVGEPNDLEGIQGRNGCLGMLMILRDSFANPRWELLGEAARLLDSCIAKLQS
ncbi:Zinc finger C2H2 type domain-containing protein [Penicillium ucsense]|uniref:Zinc finger C2H2 type domain-containing protein n=1 Tax=Penicillium ucsense TaxID=2839758 RepID=A0A8J8W4B7_9EURO|nr:Zinc finger C2H2 type domain-containing protein [Penicillium ucsense]KAF7739633.1 Zinc finger C2H2 type domain-containing protein [Penicillium ucsense]